MHYVYIIQSISCPNQIYVGCTEDVQQRLADHNRGNTFHTNKYTPWKLVMYLAFADKYKAGDFERYLKSGSGRAFRDKRLV